MSEARFHDSVELEFSETAVIAQWKALFSDYGAL